MEARASATVRVLVLVTCAAVGAGWIAARLLLLGLEPVADSYRNANRLWTFALVGLPVALTLLFLSRPALARKRSWSAYAVALAGALALPAGSYVEFYRGDARGWILFGAGLLIFSIGCLVLGLLLRQAQVLTVLETRVVQSLGLLALAGSVAGHFFMLFSLLFGAAWTWLGWRVYAPSAVAETTPWRAQVGAGG